MKLLCPICKVALDSLPQPMEKIACLQCGRQFSVVNGIPLLYWPTENTEINEVSNIVKAFYEKTPFPNYYETDTVDRLIQKAERSVFAKLLDDQIPENATVLEVGCGTGQLSNYLAIGGRQVIGTDMCLNSLSLGQSFCLDQEIDTVKFVQMNLFRPVFMERVFDVVICNGVLHHTQDPFAGFKSISTLVKPGGYIIIGLYNKFGRIWTNMRRSIFRLSGNRFQFLDSYLNRSDVDEIKKRTWFADQYLHPHEVSHTLDEVLGWLDHVGFEYVNAIPKPKPFAKFSQFESLFIPSSRGSRVEHILAQFQLALNGGAEGGFFVVIGTLRNK